MPFDLGYFEFKIKKVPLMPWQVLSIDFHFAFHPPSLITRIRCPGHTVGGQVTRVCVVKTPELIVRMQYILNQSSRIFSPEKCPTFGPGVTVTFKSYFANSIDCVPSTLWVDRL